MRASASRAPVSRCGVAHHVGVVLAGELLDVGPGREHLLAAVEDDGAHRRRPRRPARPRRAAAPASRCSARSSAAGPAGSSPRRPARRRRTRPRRTAPWTGLLASTAPPGSLGEGGLGRPASGPGALSRRGRTSARRGARRGCGSPNVSDRFSSVSTCPASPAATTDPPRNSSTCVMPGGSSSTWWVTSTDAGASGSSASRVSRRSRSSRPPRSMPAAGSSSSSSSGSVISARAICTRLRSPSLRVPKRALGESGHPEPVEQPDGAPHVEPAVGLAPAAEHRVPGADDDVGAPRSPPGIRSASAAAGQPDARPQLEDVDAAQSLAEDVRLAGRRVHRRRRDLQQRRLARAVRAEDGPALVLLDGPVDRVEQRLGARGARVTSTNCSTASGLISATPPSKRTPVRAHARARRGARPASGGMRAARRGWTAAQLSRPGRRSG